jgi:hypothetical protein
LEGQDPYSYPQEHRDPFISLDDSKMKVILWSIISWPSLALCHVTIWYLWPGFLSHYYWCPLWQEYRSVIYSCSWASPAQSLLGLPDAWRDVFSLKFQTPPSLECQVLVFIFPGYKLAQWYPKMLGLSNSCKCFYMLCLQLCI